jgi:hypothetical protein
MCVTWIAEVAGDYCDPGGGGSVVHSDWSVHLDRLDRW